MTTPICPNLRPTVYREDVDGVTIREAPEHEACIGSACAKWVPIVSDALGEKRPAAWRDYVADVGRIPVHEIAHGLCADNLQRAPWPDPAKEAKR
jgi:hypothetical protein